MSILQTLQTAKDKELNDLTTTLTCLCRAHMVFLKWIPSHCGVLGYEAADTERRDPKSS